MLDLEIYIRDLKLDGLSEWLQQQFETLDLATDKQGGQAVLGTGVYRGSKVSVSVYPGAFGKRYTCLILEGDELPWSSDIECARNAWRALETEIRCSPGDWKEGEPVEDDKWWRIDARGEQQVVWN